MGFQPEDILDLVATTINDLPDQELEYAFDHNEYFWANMFEKDAVKIDGGTRYNIISDSAQMDCTLRTLNEEVRDKIKEALPKFCDGIAKAHGGSAEVKIIKGYAVGVNAKEVNDHIRKTYKELFNADNLIEQEKPVLGAEDFFEFSLRGKIPVAMFWMSTTNKEKGFIAPNHASTFDIDEEVLFMGTATLAGSAMSYLNSN